MLTRRVAEEFLDGTEVGAVGEQVGGEGVAEGVGVGGLRAFLQREA